MHWKTTTVLLCVYGITKEFRPATPFLTPYLVSPYKNFTLDEVYGMIFPFWTYSYMIFLVPVFFLTDILRYKPVIVLEGTCLSLTWILLVWGKGIVEMRLMQIAFGFASAAEVAYYSYLYAIVNEKNYRRVTSFVRSAALTGKLLAYSLAQVLISTRTATYLTLNQISLVAVVCVFFIALALPPAKSRSGQCEAQSESLESKTLDERVQEQRATFNEDLHNKPRWGMRNYIVNVLESFKIFKNNMVVLKWSLWWALTSCGIFQVYNYIQSLWIEMQPDPTDVENGLVEFGLIFSGAVLSFFVQFAVIDWVQYGELVLTLSSLLITIVLAVISQTDYVWIAYSGYVCVTATYHTLITAARCFI
ncbi:unnamed protein product [Angiostrongylus costaricensis]|uniref:Thiamine transporter 2 n=1 Tax=Angiostrongylus costaricensis TaxID=334426 RepID=A0A0R3PPR7_ANGCS|nr:unnamed protein product [Angiostrongylus costaricensis]